MNTASKFCFTLFNKLKIMITWTKYKTAIQRNCTNLIETEQVVMFWRNNLFANTLIYLLPLCFIALVPSVILIISTKFYIIAVVDFVVVATIFFVAFMPKLGLKIRKIIFISTVYMLSFMLLFYVGIVGSGMVYLLTACLFTILIFPLSGYWPAWINFLFCFIYGCLIYFNLLPSNNSITFTLGEWVAISTNLIFVSFLFTILIPGLFKSLQTTINKELDLQNELMIEKSALTIALKKLSQKNEELEQFSYIASHDLQEPLRMISGFLKQIENKYNDKLDEKGKQYIYFAVDGAQRMHRIILDLLEYSRAGKIEAAKEKVDINNLFIEINILFQRQIKEKGASISCTNLPVLFTYRTLIEQVFQNLISNALKYSETVNKLKISISSKDIGSHWLFAVEDNGIGIDPEYFKKIFVIFQRLHNKNEYSGTGLGLAICQKVIDYLGGEIWVESNFGKGSIFYFTVLKDKKT